MPTLDQLPRDTRARVASVTATGSVAQRLLEMGLIQGAEIRLVGAAPLGDPLEFLVQDYHLSLRKAEAALVEIELD